MLLIFKASAKGGRLARGGGGYKRGMYEIRGKEGGAGFIKEQGLKNLKLWTGLRKREARKKGQRL